MDLDDEPALFVDAILREGIPPLPGEVLGGAGAALRRELLNSGETRFPYLSALHPDDIYADEESKQARLAEIRPTNG